MLLAIDQGTTGTTCLVVDESLRTLGRGYQELPQHFPAPGLVEHDADEIWQTVIDASAAALADAGIGAGELAAIGISNQRETTLVWDQSEPVRRSSARSCGRTGGRPRAALSCPSS